MTSLIPARRAAEEFDRVLDGSATTAVTERYAELVGTVSTLRDLPLVTPRADFAADLRERLMTAAATELVAAPPVVDRSDRLVLHRPPRTAHGRRLGTVAASLVIVGGSAGMAAATSGSLPGEALYPVKRGIEHVGTAARLGDASKGQDLLDQAATRLDEARTLQERGDVDHELLAQTIDSFRNAADAGSDRLFAAYQADGKDADVARVRTFTSTQMAQLSRMSGGPDARDDALLADAADTLTAIDQQARVLCAGCSDTAAVEMPLTLVKGSAAASVDSLLSRPVEQARLDIAQAQQALDAARLRQLQRAAERGAAELAEKTPATEPTPSTGEISQSQPATDSLTRGGALLETTAEAGDAAVKDLVTGVTGTVTGVTGQLTSNTPLEKPTKDLTDTVDGVTGGLLPTP